MPVLSTLGAATAKAWGFLQQVAAAADPYFNYVTMLLTGNGTNGAQNNTFLDSSSNAFTITRNGNTTQGSFSPYGSLWSNYFNGEQYWSLSVSSSASIASSGDFTYECWIFPTATDGYRGVLTTKNSLSAIIYSTQTYNLLMFRPSLTLSLCHLYFHKFACLLKIDYRCWLRLCLSLERLPTQQR